VTDAPTVLIFVQISTHFVEQVRVAELLVRSARYRPVVLFMAPYEGHVADMARCRALGVACIGPNDLAAYLPDESTRPSWLMRFAPHRMPGFLRPVASRVGRWLTEPVTSPSLPAIAMALGRPLVVLLRPLLRPLAKAAFRLVYARRSAMLPAAMRAQRFVWRLAPGLVRSLDVRLLIIPEDNFYYFTNFFVRALHDHGGRALVVPFTIVNTREWAEAFHRLPSHDPGVPIHGLIATLFLRLLHRYLSKTLTMPAQEVLRNVTFGVAPRIPWLINSGHADAIAVESPFMQRYYLAAGIEPERLRLVGALADDVLYRQRLDADDARRRLYRELALEEDRPMVLCALPPNQLLGDGRPQSEVTNYDEVVRAFLEPLRWFAGPHHVIVSLHPRATPSDLATIGRYGVHVARTNVAELVPLTTLYVASASATIRLAMSCGIPTVNYDIYRYGYDDYEDVPGVVTVSRRGDYEATLARMLAAGRAADADDVALAAGTDHIDGRAGERLLALIEELVDGVDADVITSRDTPGANAGSGAGWRGVAG